MNLLVTDIGGSKMRIGFFRGNRLISSRVLAVPKTWSSGRKRLQNEASRLAREQNISRIVVGIAGVFNQEKSKLVASPHLRGWVNQPIKKDLEYLFKKPVILENDAALAGLGEARTGAGKGKQIAAYLSVGTGVGGARIVNGQIDANIFGFEPGHQIIDGGETLEERIGGRWLTRRLGKHWEKYSASDWRQIEKDLSIGLVNLVNFWSPDIIVLGGSVVLDGNVSISSVRLTMRRQLRTIKTIPAIVKAAHGQKSALYGGRYI